MNGNITKEGIRKDLEWMKNIGIQGVQNFDGGLDTPQIVKKRLAYMAPEWKEALRYAVRLADEFGLEFAIASSPGWSETGGPWVKPEDGMKKLVWTETQLQGGGHIRLKLAKPPCVAGPFQGLPIIDRATLKPLDGPELYRDALVIAYRTPPTVQCDPLPLSVTTSEPEVDGSRLTNAAITEPVWLRCSNHRCAWVRYDYGVPQRWSASSLSSPSPAMAYSWVVEASDDGEHFRAIAEFSRSYFSRRTTVAFKEVWARFLRLSVWSKPIPDPFDCGANAPGAVIPNHAGHTDRVALSELKFYRAARIHRFEDKAGFSIATRYCGLDSPQNISQQAVSPADVADITNKLRGDELDWNPPDGDWTVLRLGYSLTGKTNHPASREATGLEVDKLDRRAVKAYLEEYFRNFEEAVGRDWIGKRGIGAFLTDSIETSGQNWTPTLIEEFKERRGYDPIVWLPTLTGVIVGDAARSDGFLWDFRKTLMELLSEAHYGQIAASAHERGVRFYAESLEGYPGMSLGDDLDMRQHADVPMAAIWTSYKSTERDGLSWHIADMRGAASVAHVLGKNVVAAESLTSVNEPWAFSPATLRPIMDLAFALGVNLPVIHTSVHQPVDKKPGLSLGPFGQQFTRHETWAEMAGPWVAYLSRCAYLLQLGRFVADIAWFYGEDDPLAGVYAEGDPPNLPEGYSVDFVSANMLLNHLKATGGKLISTGGAQYSLLYLGGSSERMTLSVLRKLKDLSSQGITIVGRRPIGSPSLADAKDTEEYQRLAKQLWEGGKVLSSSDPSAALATLKLKRDFDYRSSTPGARVMFVHRSLPDCEVYFITNRRATDEQIEATFRVSGVRPELWHADSGERRSVSWRAEEGRTVLQLNLCPNESVFVVFREATTELGEEVPPVQEYELLRVEGPWELSFEPERGAPEETLTTPLGSWSESEEVGIRYFSGIGTYRKTFDFDCTTLPGEGRLILDLGRVHEVAEVFLNGKLLGTAWHPPFELDVTEAIQPGVNALTVRIANLWVNRLIGDQQPGAVPVTFTTIETYKPDAPLRDSGLIGPVLLKRRITRVEICT